MRTSWTWTTLCLLAACGTADPTDKATETDTDIDTDAAVGATDAELAADLWDAMAGFDAWSQPANWDGIQPQADGSPHGPFVEVFLNDQAESDYDGVAAGGEFSDGAILAKRLYDSAEDTSGKDPIYAMWKIDGYGSTGWFWATFSSDGTPGNDVGDLSGCTGCHSAGDDYSRVVTDVPGDGT